MRTMVLTTQNSVQIAGYHPSAVSMPAKQKPATLSLLRIGSLSFVVRGSRRDVVIGSPAPSFHKSQRRFLYSAFR
jgi:hypothetical protein